ncbi:hypothetical protein PSAL_038060 (plasmid) [Pseudooceanicola algae]|uniref:Uncharacterized protein n=1 Tax=Pseudooceanicola algae TaxID=1537215 RepID=A0A7T1BY17_9RHOB|nr:hypothetical protein PSAL_038060 [Pseudooceanicola algae]
MVSEVVHVMAHPPSARPVTAGVLWLPSVSELTRNSVPIAFPSTAYLCAFSAEPEPSCVVSEVIHVTRYPPSASAVTIGSVCSEVVRELTRNSPNPVVPPKLSAAAVRLSVFMEEYLSEIYSKNMNNRMYVEYR